MAAAGGRRNLVKHYRETSFFGIVQVLRNLGTIRRQMRECRDDVAAYGPDVLILVDYPGFNMKMARWAHGQGLRVFYYIAPKVWAWREHRVKAIRRYVDRLFVIFPFETKYFPAKGIRPVFEGNPLVDAIEARRPSLPSGEAFRREHGLDRRPIVALLAGSRKGEIRDNLPLMAALARKFPDRQFVVAGVSWLDRSLYEPYPRAAAYATFATGPTKRSTRPKPPWLRRAQRPSKRLCWASPKWWSTARCGFRSSSGPTC